MDNLWCKESYLHVSNTDPDDRYHLGANDPYETFTDNVGKLYRSCLKDMGRCTGRMYVGEDKPKQVGWVFLKKNSDGDGLIETWVEVFVKPPIKRIIWEPGTHPSFQRPKKEKKATLSPMVGGGMRLTPDYQ